MFDNVISLGFFCGVAQETERLGLRAKSMPFDWVISPSFSIVLDLIENNFNDYVGCPHYFEDCSNRADNDVYQIQFFHDFKRPASINDQLEGVKETYKRRATYFNNAVTKPTLFIRYIFDSDEYEWIKTHHERIDQIIKSGNPNNEIIFVGHHQDDECFGYKYFQVEPDEGDVVARRFTQSNEEAYSFLTNDQLFNTVERRKNRLFYKWGRFKKWLKKFPDKGKSLLGRNHQ